MVAARQGRKSIRGERLPRVALAVAMLAQGVAAAVQFGVASVSPEIERHYGLGIAALAVILAAWLFGNGVSLIPVGMAVDRYGARRVTTIGGLVAGCGLLAAAHSSNTPELAAGLFLAGVGGATVPVAGSWLMFSKTPVSRRGVVFGLRQTAGPLGGVLAIVIMPVLTHIDGLDGAFTILSVASVASYLWLAVMCSVATERKGDGVGLGDVWRSPGIVRVFAIAACYAIVMQVVVVYTVPAVRAAGFTDNNARLVFVVGVCVAVVARVAWGRFVDRDVGTRRGAVVLTWSGCIATIGAGAFALALHSDVVAVVLTAGLFAAGALGWNGVMFLSVAEFAPTHVVARALAVAFTLVSAVSALGTIGLGLVIDFAGWGWLWISAALLGGLGAWASQRSGHAPRTA